MIARDTSSFGWKGNRKRLGAFAKWNLRDLVASHPTCTACLLKRLYGGEEREVGRAPLGGGHATPATLRAWRRLFGPVWAASFSRQVSLATAISTHSTLIVGAVICVAMWACIATRR